MTLQFKITMFAATLFIACSSDDAKHSASAAKKSSDAEKNKPTENEYPTLEKAQEIDPNAITGGKTALLDAKYAISVKSAFDLEVCKGDLQLNLNVNFGTNQDIKMLDFPEGVIDCGEIGTLDPKAMLGSTNAGTNTKMTVENGLIYVSAIGNGEYDPRRPMFPAFLSEAKDVLKDLYHKESVKMTDKVDKKEASGDITVEMVNFDVPYTVEKLKVTFPHTLRFAVTINGFDGVKKMSNMLFKKMEFVFSIDPIALLHIHFEGTAADAIGSADAMKAKSQTTKDLINTVQNTSKNDDLIGNLTRGALNAVDVAIDLDLQSMTGLDLPTGAKP